MKEPTYLHSKLQETLSTENIDDLIWYSDKAFIDSLADEERGRLAWLFIKQARFFLSESFEEKQAERAIDMALFASSDPELRYDAANLYFHLGLFSKKAFYHLQGQELLLRLYVRDTDFFIADERCFQLSGNLLMALYRKLGDEELLLEARGKFGMAISYLFENEGNAFQLYWDASECATFLAKSTKERGDCREALELFRVAAHLSEENPYFLVDFASTLLELSPYCSDLIDGMSLLDLAIATFKKVIEREEGKANRKGGLLYRAWSFLCQASRRRLFLYGDLGDLRAADHAYHQAILAHPEASELWLDWGEMLLGYGWLFKDVRAIEQGLEKLTSLKSGQTDPIRGSYLLGGGMIMLGLFAEDYGLLVEGRERMRVAHSIEKEVRSKKKSSAPLAFGFADLAFGLYFSDKAYLEKAAKGLEKHLKAFPDHPEARFILFEAYLSLALATEKKRYLKRGFSHMERLTEIAPEQFALWHEWGYAILRFGEVERSEATLAEAMKKLERSLELKPSDSALFSYASALLIRGDLEGDDGDYEEALLILSDLVLKSPRPLYLLQRAIALSRLGEIASDLGLMQEALATFERLIECEGDNELLLAEWGYLLLVISEHVEDADEKKTLQGQAEKRLLGALSLAHYEVHYHLACLYSLVGRLDLSLCHLVAAIDYGVIQGPALALHDDWLAALSKSEGFQKILEEAKG